MDTYSEHHQQQHEYHDAYLDQYQYRHDVAYTDFLIVRYELNQRYGRQPLRICHCPGYLRSRFCTFMGLPQIQAPALSIYHSDMH